MILTILIFIAILSVLVFVHEFGHFYVARKSGMKVDEFGFGFPPRIVGIQKVNNRWNLVWGLKPPKDLDQTVYSINLIPLGGFVKIMGENNEGESDPRSFINRPFWGRFLTLIAGVFMNVLLAWVLVSAGFVFGLPAAIDDVRQLPKHAVLRDPQVAIVELVPGRPAEKAGLKAGDIIVSVDGVNAQDQAGSQTVRAYITSNAGKELDFKIRRIKNILEVKVKSVANPGPGQGPTGIVLTDIGKLSYPWYIAPFIGAKTVYFQIIGIITGLYSLLTAKLGFASLGGPVQIARLTGQVADLGFVYVLQFAAFLSLNLAVLNILPFPALDGGRILFLIIEKIRGKRNNQKMEQIANTAGFVALIFLMIAVTVKDLIKK